MRLVLRPLRTDSVHIAQPAHITKHPNPTAENTYTEFSSLKFPILGRPLFSLELWVSPLPAGDCVDFGIETDGCEDG